MQGVWWRRENQERSLPLCYFLLSVPLMQVYAHAGAELEGKIYITCGRRGEDYLKELQCYDPAINRWDILSDSPIRRAWHGMAALLGRLYVIGGSNNDSGYRRDVHEVRQPLAWLMAFLLHAAAI